MSWAVNSQEFLVVVYWASFFFFCWPFLFGRCEGLVLLMVRRGTGVGEGYKKSFFVRGLSSSKES